jgi:large subunit ribosomal protein L4e
MKAKIFDKEGKAGKEIELPGCFSENVREDICQKYYEASKDIQPYAPFWLAGKQASASGIVRHARNKWKTAYGHGISRVPRKIFWRRGTQFYWQAATVTQARGGRRAHGPRVEHFEKKLKINKKEKKFALASGISATALPEYLKRRYERLTDKEIKNLPFVVESNILKLKMKEFLTFLRKILGENFDLALQEKKKRAGRGKTRGRKYKSSAGLLFVVGKNEKFARKGIDTRKVNELGMADFWPLGRLAVYTETAVNDLGKLFGGKK